ncbi:MAG: polysaccharide deacetylase family protein [Chthonomonadaceae bacterium]|nr:polysaccharide deacetylase family protein [Chthonomonadaceae bacterium]
MTHLCEHNSARKGEETNLSFTNVRRMGRLAGMAAMMAISTLACNQKPLPDSQPPAPLPPVVSVATPPPAAATSAYDNICIQAQSDRVPVIMYHDVIAKRGKGAVWFDCTKAEFEEQMNWLEAQGAHVVSLDDLYKHLTAGDALPENAVVLTFDDNYQGFYDNAYPILKKRNYPSAMFVHTNYVGDKKSDHPKMDWETLKQLDAEKLVTIGSHTQSHPDDMRKLPPDEQEKEMSGAKTILETHLGHPIPYLAYPNGRQDNVTKELARKCGYTMAFTIDNGPAEASPDILLVNRTIQTRLEKVWKECHDAKLYAPAAVAQFDLNPTPVKLEIAEFGGVKLGIVRGGSPTTHHSPVRQSVGQFITDVPGGVAGINGTFFADARLNGADTTLIGPSQNPSDTTLVPDLAEERLPRLINRPIVLWGPKKIAIVPFQPGTMNAADPFKAFMPDYTELFLAGAWIVHGGVPRTTEEMQPFSAGDFSDPRRRAFFGITESGEIILGASLDVVDTEKLAAAAAAAGAKEAVLLDSGFSTSLCYNGKVVVSGHTSSGLVSRAVPHAIVLTGTLEPPTDVEVLTAFNQADGMIIPLGAPGSETGAATGTSTHHRKRRKRHKTATTHTQIPTDTLTPAPDSAPPKSDSPNNP